MINLFSKRGAISLFLSLALISQAYSQAGSTVKLVNEVAKTADYKDEFYKIAFSNTYGTFCFRMENYKPTIDRLNAEMKVEKTVSFDHVEKRDGGAYKNIRDILCIKNNIWVFSSIYYRKTKETAFVAQKIDPVSLNYISPEIELGRNKQVYYHSHNIPLPNHVIVDDNHDAAVSLTQSAFIATADKSSLILYMNNYDLNILKKPEAITLIAFDDEMKKLWETSHTFSYDAEKMTITKVVADNQTNVFITGEVRSKGKMVITLEKTSSVSSAPVLFSFTNKGQTIKEHTLQFSGAMLAQLFPVVGINNKLQLAGTVVDKQTRATGMYYGILDISTLQFISQNEFPFGAEFVKEDLTANKQAQVNKKVEKGHEASIEYVFYHNSIVASDGTLYVVFAEANPLYDKESSSGMVLLSGYYNRRYLCFSFDISGKEKWKSKITRASHGEMNLGKFANHCALQIVNNNLLAVYSDDPKENEFQSVNPEMADNKHNIGLICAEFDKESGKYTKHLFYSSNKPLINLPFISHSLITTNKQIIFCSYRQNKNYQYGLVEF
jgi:hypothetical protein